MVPDTIPAPIESGTAELQRAVRAAHTDPVRSTYHRVHGAPYVLILTTRKRFRLCFTSPLLFPDVVCGSGEVDICRIDFAISTLLWL